MQKKNNSSKLDQEEQEIEDSLESMSSISGHKRSKIIKAHKNAAKHYLKQNKTVTIKVNEKDLEILKDMAEGEGLNYQVFITNILHKVCIDKLKNNQHSNP